MPLLLINMFLTSEVGGGVVTILLASGVLGLVSAGLLWRRLLRQLGAAEHERKRNDERLSQELAQVRKMAEDAASRSVSADANAGACAAASKSAAQAAERSAQSSERSALAATETASALRATAESARRAWVHAVEFKLTLKTQAPDNSSLDVSIANLGATPARELKVSTNFLICDDTPDEPQLKPRVLNVALGPGVSFSLSHFLRVSQADYVAVSSGRKVLLSCGKAQYRDVFDLERETSWCAQYDATAKAFLPSAKHNLTL
jgi:hypothetical protein